MTPQPDRSGTSPEARPREGRRETLLWILFLFALALIPRLHGLAWDDLTLLHPDERFLLMTVTDMDLTRSPSEYLDPARSPMNPYNRGKDFFVYGTLPLLADKILVTAIGRAKDLWGAVALVGRLLTALADAGVVLLVLWAGLLLARTRREERGESDPPAEVLRIDPLGGDPRESGPFWAAFLYAISVLPIQLSHFFAVDPYLNLFGTAAIVLALPAPGRADALRRALGSGLCLGLALACKVTAGLSLLPVLFLFGVGLRDEGLRPGEGPVAGSPEAAPSGGFPALRALLLLGILLLSAYGALRLADPHLFASANLLDPRPNPRFLANLRTLRELHAQVGPHYPPTITWAHRIPLLYPLQNLVLWGLGLPLAALSLAGLGLLLFRPAPLGRPLLVRGLLLWVAGSFVFLAFQQRVATMRYFLPFYPWLALCGGTLFARLERRLPRPAAAGLLLLLLVWPVSFLSIYGRLNPRLAASEWIYANVPKGSTLTAEYWDDALPLWRPGGRAEAYGYRTIWLPVFEAERPDKIDRLNALAASADFLILSSGRGWANIRRAPDIYPRTAAWYEDLFAGRLPWREVARFESFPTLIDLGPLRIRFPDASAEENFTVYDHPQVRIFRRTAPRPEVSPSPLPTGGER